MIYCKPHTKLDIAVTITRICLSLNELKIILGLLYAYVHCVLKTASGFSIYSGIFSVPLISHYEFKLLTCV